MEGVIGFTTLFAGNFAPKNWAYCQGQIIPIAQNTALFSILGTVYGGNGTTTFGLPNLSGRRVVGAGQGPGLSPYSLGQMGGSENVTLSLNQMPAHIHPLQIVAHSSSYDDTGNTSSPGGSIYAANGSGYSGSGGVQMKPYSVAVQMSNIGNNQAYSIVPPYLGLNYVICMYGVFPARG
ncbi:phage tail protein [Taibaiella koreensis]|uniref:phage tail protein n=1 Tax=Taibaiella koreensis TaxID=1268548 RepID=UPI000E59B1FC|nr:tail fiber protein [Taibaiella koreensis]